MKDGPIKSYRDLKVWNAAMDLAEETYKVTSVFPKEEIYGLSAQMRRSAVSIPSNIAEGFGRENRGSFTQFLRIAQGSLKELETQMMLALRVNFVNEAQARPILDLADEVGRMLRGLIRSVKAGETGK